MLVRSNKNEKKRVKTKTIQLWMMVAVVMMVMVLMLEKDMLFDESDSRDENIFLDDDDDVVM